MWIVDKLLILTYTVHTFDTGIVCLYKRSEPEFVNLLRSSGNDSQHGGPVRQPFLTYRPARLHRQAESIPGLLKRLQIRTLVAFLYLVGAKLC